MRPIYRISILAVSAVLVIKCLQKLEQLNEYVRSPPPVKATEQPTSRPPRFVKSSINKHDDR